MTHPTPVALDALDIAPRGRPSTYPQAIQALLGERLVGREKRALGDAFGLTNFGVNLTRLAPGAVSALRHAHSRQDELIYILAGSPTLRTNEGSVRLASGMCAGFKAGTGNASQLLNETGEDVLVLEIGDRSSGDEVTYPDDDLFATFADGQWRFFHQDGTPY
jgi:uncharacterized cupin superfamily protein